MDTAAQDDRALVEAVRRGDRAGLEGMYRRYADRLYTYARVLVREPEAAADVVHDAFLAASRRIDQLRDPDRLRPWLYAIVRNECLRQLRERSRSSALEEAGDPVADTVDPGAGVNADQVRELVHSATAALNPGDREVVHLAIRHDLSPVDIGAALGVPANHAHARLSRARSQLERALGALLVARSGSRDCAALAGLLDGWQGRLTPTLRKRVARHIDGCAACGLLRREQLNPAALLSAYTAPGFLVVADTVWPRLADSAWPGSVDGGPAEAADGGVTGAADGGSGASADAATASPPAPVEPAGPSQTAGPDGGPQTAGPAEGAASAEGGHTARSAERPPAGPATALAGGGAAAPRAGSESPRTASRSRRRRRRLAASAGLLVLLAAAGTWALGPGRPAADRVAATSGAAADGPATPRSGPVGSAGPTDAAAPGGSGAPAGPGPDGAGGTPTGAVPPGAPPPGATGPVSGPGSGPGPTASSTGSPVAPRPTGTPKLATAFTLRASAHVRCGADTYTLVVQATGSAAIEAAQVRWTASGGTASSRAMAVDGSTARASVGQLRASALTWTVRATAADGRTAQSPSYPVTDPCLRPG